MAEQSQTPTTKVAFNIYMPISLKQSLETRAISKGISVSAIIREALNAHINHTIHRMYTCPDGVPCRCPQMFQQPQQPPPPQAPPIPNAPAAEIPVNPGG